MNFTTLSDRGIIQKKCFFLLFHTIHKKEPNIEDMSKSFCMNIFFDLAVSMYEVSKNFTQICTASA